MSNEKWLEWVRERRAYYAEKQIHGFSEELAITLYELERRAENAEADVARLFKNWDDIELDRPK